MENYHKEILQTWDFETLLSFISMSNNAIKKSDNKRAIEEFTNTISYCCEELESRLVIKKNKITEFIKEKNGSQIPDENDLAAVEEWRQAMAKKKELFKGKVFGDGNV